ncbi:MAG: precorrin-6y C5,15-methyltransferase (decarboxylating) subunit CbiE [Candidatus Humimicrobiaceae bacterium]
MDYKIHVVGIGPGAEDYVCPMSRKLIEDGDILIGGRRNLFIFKNENKEKFCIGKDLEKLYDFINKNKGKKKIVVLASGDPGLFSITGFLKQRFQDEIIDVTPGISSLQYLCSKLVMRWDDLYILSAHGRKLNDIPAIVATHEKTAIFTGALNKPQNICAKLLDAGIKDAEVYVGEKLSYPDEKIFTGKIDEVAKKVFSDLCVMIIKHKMNLQLNQIWQYLTYGIPDSFFERTDIPMTKEEIRAIAISKLRLKKDSVVYDIGAGTGSISVECGLICKRGKVFSIEKNINATNLIALNIQKFGLKNVSIIKGQAPEAVSGLTCADRVFIGGSGKKMNEIIGCIAETSKEIKVVINAVTIESAHEAIKSLNINGFKNIEVINVNVSRSVSAGDKHMMQALNPVYIISSEKGGGD